MRLLWACLWLGWSTEEGLKKAQLPSQWLSWHYHSSFIKNLWCHFCYFLMFTKFSEACFLSAKCVNVTINDSADLGFLLGLGHCPMQSLSCLGGFQETLQKHPKKLVNTYLDILDHSPVYSFMPWAIFSKCRLYRCVLGLSTVLKSSLYHQLVICSDEYFVSFLKGTPISCLQSSHRGFSPLKIQFASTLTALPLRKHSGGGVYIAHRSCVLQGGLYRHAACFSPPPHKSDLENLGFWCSCGVMQVTVKLFKSPCAAPAEHGSVSCW